MCQEEPLSTHNLIAADSVLCLSGQAVALCTSCDVLYSWFVLHSCNEAASDHVLADVR